MTTIEDIKTELREIIELSDKATPGPWDNENGPYVYAHIPGGRPNGEYIMQVCCGNGAGKPLGREMNKLNAHLIAASRNLTPKMVKSLLGVIERLESEAAAVEIAMHGQPERRTLHAIQADRELETIRREWEVQV